MYAKDLQLTNLKASNGWLLDSSFAITLVISATTLSGERASSDLLTIETLRKCLLQINYGFVVSCLASKCG